MLHSLVSLARPYFTPPRTHLSLLLSYDTVSSFDPLDPDYEPTMAPLLKAKTGRYVAINGSPSDWLRGMVDQFITQPLFGVGIQRAQYDLFLLRPTRATLSRLALWLDRGDIPVMPIDSSYDIRGADGKAKLDEAFARMKSRRTVGKIVFDFSLRGEREIAEETERLRAREPESTKALHSRYGDV